MQECSVCQCVYLSLDQLHSPALHSHPSPAHHPTPPRWGPRGVLGQARDLSSQDLRSMGPVASRPLLPLLPVAVATEERFQGC